MYIYGTWLLDETTGTNLSDSSGNDNDGTTNGTLSGGDGVQLTESQTINLPVEISTETSLGVFFFAKATISQKEQTLISNTSGVSMDSLTIGVDSSGLVYADHGGNRVLSTVTLDGNETHIGYIYDNRYYTQQLFINGVAVATETFSNPFTNNTNSFTVGESFSGNVRKIYMYSGEISSSVPEGLYNEEDIELILPSGTVYASRVQVSGDIITRDVLFRDEYLVSSGTNTKKNHFVYDSTTDEVIQTSSIKNNTDGTLGVMVKDSSIMSTPLKIKHDAMTIGLDDNTATLDTSGLKFKSESAGIYFGGNQEFRITMTTDTPSRLTFQNFDTTTQEYVTKYSVANK